jgi:tRNA (guanine37-N1)-methyltransferase
LRIDIITVLPDLLQSPLNHSIIKRARDKGLIEVHLQNLREYGVGLNKNVDDYAFGGGAGMVMMIEPIVNCIESLKKQRSYDAVIYMTPDGELLDQKTANSLSLLKNIIILCGHYKGIDERIREHFITREISIGDYVLTGGELPALVLTDAICRLIPGVISDEESALSDSFQDNLLAPPVYTRPAKFRKWEVPEVLTSGNFAKIEKWQMDQAIERTKARRPNLLNDEIES